MTTNEKPVAVEHDELSEHARMGSELGEFTRGRVGGAMSDSLTILRCATNLVMAKTWNADGSFTPYSSAKYFQVEEASVHTIDDLAALLGRLESDPQACVIRGTPKSGLDPKVRRLIENFDDNPLHTILIEVDQFQPLVSDPLDGEESALEYIAECLPEPFWGASFHWQLSNSAGAPGKEGQFRGHLWMMLDTPYDSATLRAWAKAEGLALDRAVFQVVQPHYTSSPIFEPGVECPVKVRSGLWRGSRDSVPLVIDTEALTIRSQGVRQRGERLAGVEDQLADYVEAHWETWDTLANGGIMVSCPWEDEHSSGTKGDTSSAYFPAGTNSYPEGAYICLHTSCRERGRGRLEFANAVGYTDTRLAMLAEPQPDGGKPQAEGLGWLDADPVDLWRSPEPSALSEGLLPPVIERFARSQAELMGVDPGGLAAAALAVCAAAIPDYIQVQVKEHDRQWKESARLWVGLVGLPSTKKSPLIMTAARPLRKIEQKLRRDYGLALVGYKQLSAEDQKAQAPPVCPQLILEDTTIEAAQEVFANTPTGVLCLQDELSGWFGAMDKYGGGKGAAKDRAFWLQSFNGGTYTVNRVGRGSVYIENLSASLLGGIQPDPIRRVVAEANDDGLIQRLIPIVLQGAELGSDQPQSDVTDEYERVVGRLREASLSLFEGSVLRFASAAQDVRNRLEARHHELLRAVETVNPKLASHFGKYDGIFARLCVVFHAVENVDAHALPQCISEDTAERAGRFLHDFLLTHAVAFYGAVLGGSEDQHLLRDIGGNILAHEKTEVSIRDLHRGSQSMKAAVTREEGKKPFERLEALGWLRLAPQKSPNAASRWLVNPAVHAIFADRARCEAERRAEVQQVFAGLGR